MEILVCLLLITVSGFISGSEIALFSLSRFQLRAMKDRFKRPYRKLKALLGDPAGLLTTVLLVNEMLNISISALITGGIDRQLGPGVDWSHKSLIGTLITTPLILLFCEITPKVIGARANQLVAPLVVTPLGWIHTATWPLRYLIRRCVLLFAKILARFSTPPSEEAMAEEAAEEAAPLLKEQDFLVMLEEGQKEGAIHASELNLIRNVLELDDLLVSDVLTPLSKVYSLPATASLRYALTAMRLRKYSRVPITGANRREIVGILYAKDLLLEDASTDRDQANVASLMRKPYAVAPTVSLNSLFRRLKVQRIHMAVVEARPGEAIGIVTMNDLLEALIEDFIPERTGPVRGAQK